VPTFRRWRSSHLLLAWTMYWLALIAVTLGRALAAAWRATHADPGHGSINGSITDGLVHVDILRDGVRMWAGSATVGEIVFWFAVPPLLLWLGWLASRPRDGGVATVRAASDRAALGMAPDERWPVRERKAEDPVRPRVDRAD
jgi:hypothetical protein